jgi:hypothetical protein
VLRNCNGNDTVIHAHRIILAAGSAYFTRKYEVGIAQNDSNATHQLIFDQEVKAAEWQIDGEDAEVMEHAIRYMYGFEIMDEGRNRYLESIHEFVELGAVAEKYEIRGLSECVLKAAGRTLAECLSDESGEDMLESSLSTFVHSGSNRESDFAVKILGEHIDVLHEKAAFQQLLGEEHDLAVELFNILAKRQIPEPDARRQWGL